KEKLVEKESRKGRPSYLYKVDVGELYEKVVGDLEELLGATKIQLKVHFKLGDTTGIKEEKAKAA
ncbi:MAG: TrmB family transcriptional regulator, partial [Sulfolobaceae archaeon]|nr:TrmB family transcriptional regulator [Sulfolobales archaeon]